MLFGSDSSKTAWKAGPLLAVLLVLALLAGISLTGRADPYQEATAGHEPIVGRSYFGTHFHRLVLNPGEKNLPTRWPDSLIGTIRLWDSGTLWSEIAGQPGQWRYDRIDTYVQQANTHGATVLYVLGGTPRWASSRPDEKCPYGLGCAAEPVRMAHWGEYVRRVVQRYRGRINAYELWNEPNFSDISRDRDAPGFYAGSVANMVEMARIARQVIDENDPNAMLSTPGFANGTDRLELFLESGGKKYVQAIAYHFYSEDTRQFARQIVEVRDVMKRQGLEKLPLWNTETGVEVNPPSSAAHVGSKTLVYPEAAARLAQFLVIGGAAGLEHFYHYAWDNERSGMMNRLGEPLPNLLAYDRVEAWLLGSRMLGCRELLPHGVLCAGEHAGVRFAIAWSDSGGSYSLPTPSGLGIASLEHLLDAGSKPYASASQDGADRVELDPQPLYIQYKAQSSSRIN
jgi:hypothetical protein